MGRISKTFALFLILIIAMSCLTLLTVKSATAQSSNTIYIDYQGNISPSDAPIKKSGDFFTLTNGIISNNAIVIYKNNIVLDGAGFALQGLGAKVASKGNTGIDASNVNNVTIKNFIISNFATCIRLRNSANSTIIQNTITSYSDEGIHVSESSNSLISKNVFSSNADLQISANKGLTLDDSFNATVSENTINGGWVGIWLFQTNNSTISGNSITQNEVGMLLRYSNNNQLTGNEVSETVFADSRGIHPNSGSGIKFYGDDHNNTVFNNRISYNGEGVALWINNTANVIYANFFQNNSRQVDQASQEGLSNSWDNGTVGNYWDDYFTKYPNATEIDHTGLGNTPYVIDANNTDNYPLIYDTDISTSVHVLTPSPTVPELNWLVILPLILSMFFVVVIIRYRETKLE